MEAESERYAHEKPSALRSEARSLKLSLVFSCERRFYSLACVPGRPCLGCLRLVGPESRHVSGRGTGDNLLGE